MPSIGYPKWHLVRKVACFLKKQFMNMPLDGAAAQFSTRFAVRPADGEIKKILWFSQGLYVA